MTEVETQTDKLDLSKFILAPVHKIVMEKQTLHAKGSECLAGVTIRQALTETMGTTRRTTETLTTVATDLWIALLQRSPLWATSTPAKSAASCSLAVLCSWRASGDSANY